MMVSFVGFPVRSPMTTKEDEDIAMTVLFAFNRPPVATRLVRLALVSTPPRRRTRAVTMSASGLTENTNASTPGVRDTFCAGGCLPSVDPPVGPAVKGVISWLR